MPGVERRLDVTVLRWYERRDPSPGIVPRWLAASAGHLPEAVPRRFGATEPLRGRIDRDGEAGLARAHAEAGSLLFLAGAPPVYHASLEATPARGAEATAVHDLYAEIDAGDERLRRFALALTHPGSLYVSASVAGGMTLAGRTLHGPAERREEHYLAPHGDWLGLPPEPPSWCWFGPAYARLVRDHVDAEPVAGGLLWTGGSWVARRTWISFIRGPDTPSRRAQVGTREGFAGAAELTHCRGAGRTRCRGAERAIQCRGPRRNRKPVRTRHGRATVIRACMN